MICRRKPGSSCCRAASERPATMGRAMNTWAMIMACTVYMRCSPPSGPVRQRKRATMRPTTTGGTPMPVLMTATTKRRPGNMVSAMAVPRGTPMSERDAEGRCRDVERAQRDLVGGGVASEEQAKGLPEALQYEVHAGPPEAGPASGAPRRWRPCVRGDSSATPSVERLRTAPPCSTGAPRPRRFSCVTKPPRRACGPAGRWCPGPVGARPGLPSLRQKGSEMVNAFG